MQVVSIAVGKTSEKQRLWDKFVDRLRDENMRVQLQTLIQEQDEKRWLAGVAKIFKKELSNMARTYKNKDSCPVLIYSWPKGSIHSNIWLNTCLIYYSSNSATKVLFQRTNAPAALTSVACNRVVL